MLLQVSYDMLKDNVIAYSFEIMKFSIRMVYIPIF